MVNPSPPPLPSQRLDEKGGRLYSDLPDGTWWEKLDEALGDSAHVFPVSFYVDETYLTGTGSQTAKPIFVQTGVRAVIVLSAVSTYNQPTITLQAC